MMTLRTPIVAILIGEGGSGGALALAVADQVWILENAVYSVISPEGCASILWKDSKRVKEAAECLKMTADHLLSFGAVEKIIKENEDFSLVYKNIYDLLTDYIKQYINPKNNKEKEKKLADMLKKRYKRFRKIGKVD